MGIGRIGRGPWWNGRDEDIWREAELRSSPSQQWEPYSGIEDYPLKVRAYVWIATRNIFTAPLPSSLCAPLESLFHHSYLNNFNLLQINGFFADLESLYN